MLTAADFAIEALQATAFVKDEELAPRRVLRLILREWADVYDGEPVALPISPTLPPEVPTVQVSSRDASLRIEVARSRVNLIWQRVGTDEVDIGAVLLTFAGRLATIFEQEGVEIGRLAAVVTRVADVPTPAPAIARHFFQDRWLSEPLNRPEQLELHAHKVFALATDLRVNSWVRIKTATRIAPTLPVVVVEQDINSLEEERAQQSFSRNQIGAFFRAVSQEFATILGLYFPPSSPQPEV